MPLAITGSSWVEIVLILSATVPVAITVVIAWFFLRGARHDPDEARLKQVQADYERSKRMDGSS